MPTPLIPLPAHPSPFPPFPAPLPPTAPRDLPQELEAREGGFLSNSTAFQDAFLHYADTLFRELGPQVKLWMT